MELDVHLTRDDSGSWGFRLIGGSDFNMPLTVVKVAPDSPAEKAGLYNGDVVCRINEVVTSDLSNICAKDIVDSAKRELHLAVKRGLYDPVLDDYEPIYETIDQEDFDQPSQPTEVQPFHVQQFLDPKQIPGELPDGLPELRDIETPPSVDALRLIESRSLTASPFVLPTKPYRPFSTEPLPDIPSLEDPIILNPNYTDKFGKIEDGEIFPETRFKLPVSEQYDPDGSKKRAKEGGHGKVKEIKFSEQSVRKDLTYEDRVKEEAKISNEMQHKTMVEEMKFMEKMKKDIDINKIEKTAVSLVDESIERAVSVADEIKKEIDVELSESIAAESKETISIKESNLEKKSAVMTSKVSNEEASKKSNELVELIDKTADNIIPKVVERIETINKKEVIDETIFTTKQELEETIVSGSVRRKSEVFDRKTDTKSVDIKQSHDKKVSADKRNEVKVISENYISNEAVNFEETSHAQKTNEIKKESVSSFQKTGAKISADTKTTSKHRAYNIGLQTIPNIKGTIHSSYHYNLLLKTFFIHLTDVMVALSRFILTEPVFNRDDNLQPNDVATESISEHTSVSKEEHLTEKSMEAKTKQEYKENFVAKKEDIKQGTVKGVVNKKDDEKTFIKKQEIVASAQTVQDEIIEYAQKKEDIKEYLEVEEALETRMLSGAKMAQLTERKSEELTQKMDAVITEFQIKAGIEETGEAREKRSRSRSRIEEEVALESDPLEWLSKVDNRESQEKMEFKSESKYFSSSEAVQKKKIETTHDKREAKTLKGKEGKQMYVAIVESHVFTNKDAIFAEQVSEFSETSSVQSADEINVALVENETISTEKVALESKMNKQEEAQSVLEESRELAIVNAQNKIVEIAEEVKIVAEEIKTQKAVEIETKAIREIIEPVVEVQETEATEIKGEIQKVEIKEEEYIMAVSEKAEMIVEEESHEIIEVEEHKKEQQADAIIIQKEAKSLLEESRELAIVNAQSKTVEIAEEVKFIAEEIKKEKAVEIETKAIQEVVIQEIMEPVVQVQETKAVEIKEEIQKVEIKEEEHVMAVSEKAEMIVKEESYEIIEVQESKKEQQAVAIIEEIEEKDMKAIKEEVNVIEPVIEEVFTELHVKVKPHPTLAEASAELKIVKEQIIEMEQTLKLTEESDISINKHTEILEFENQFAGFQKNTTQSYECREMIQKSSFTARSSEESKKLSLQINLPEQRRSQSQSSVQSDPPSTIDTPTPSVPPTPLTDEYVFKLQIPMPRGTTPGPREVSPEITEPDDEDPNIVKKKLVPHIDTTLDSPIIYDPPLPSPPLETVQSPIYSKPGLKGGSAGPKYSY